MPDLDVQFHPSAEQIRRREFATIRRGYDPEQVRGFLLALADSVESMEEELRHSKSAPVARTDRPAPVPTDARAAATGPDPYEELGKRFAGLLGTADKEAERLVSEAKAESTRILTEARAEADRIGVNAQARAEEARAESLALLEKARAEAERALASLSSRREALLEQLQTMQGRLLSAAEDLAVVIERPESGVSESPATTEDAPAATAKTPKASREDDDVMVDPRYEDLWVSTERDAVDIPDLASIELDFEEEQPSAER